MLDILKLPPTLPNDWLLQLMDAGCEISIKKDKSDVVYYDLHLNSKSHLYLYREGEAWKAHMRYDRVIHVESFHDLLAAAVDGIHGRPFIHDGWRKLLTDNGYDLSKLMHD